MRVLLLVAAAWVGTTPAQAFVVTSSSSNGAYTVSSTDLLQTHLESIDNAINLYSAGAVGTLTDGNYGAASSDATYVIANGTVTYMLNTTFVPGGYEITEINTYSGWNDAGRKDQKYTVTFRKVGSSTFGDSIEVDYVGTDTQTKVNIADLGLTGVDAIRFTFPYQQNGGVGYKEIDVIGPAPVAVYTVTGESSGSAYTVSGTDLLQTHLGSTVDALGLNNFGPGFPNSGTAALTDGVYGTAGINNTCQISGGAVTYLLNTADYLAGYVITNIHTYCGWQDAGRDDQNYTVSFRQAGSDTFGDAITVAYAGTISQTAVNIAGLSLVGVDAIQFTFPWQENGGVGYKEVDVFGSAPAYFDLTRLDSGTQVITNNAAADVLITEGAGALSDITLGAPATVIRSLTQGTTAGIATINPAGQTLSLNALYLKSDAGGLTIAGGMLTKWDAPELAVDNRSANGVTVDGVIADGRGEISDLVKSGDGLLTLNGVNTYSGVTVFGGGVVDVATLSNYGAGGALGKRSGDSFGNVSLLFRGGTLRYSGATAQRTDRAIRINADGGGGNVGGATLDASGSVPAATLSFTAAASPDFFEWGGNRSLTLTGSNTGNNTFAMAIGEASGATRVVKSGNGTWVLSGANNYRGGTFVEGGTLRSRAIGSGAVTVAAGATWDIGLFSQTLSGLSGAGNVVHTNEVITGADGAAMISTSKNYLLKLDFGNGGGATVNGVTFESVGISGAGWSLSGVGDLYGEGVGTSGYGQLMSDFYYNGKPGVLTFSSLTVGQIYEIVIYTQVGYWGGRPQDATFVNGSDTRQLLNTEPGNVGYYAYRFVASAPTATVTMTPRTGDTFHWFGASLEAVTTPVFTVGDAGDHVFSGVIGGPSKLVKQGGGKLTLSGANTYNGATTVNTGTLEITAGNALPAGTALEIVSGAGMLLNNADVQTVSALTFNGVPQYRGIWGGLASVAQYKSALFTGTGMMNVLTGPLPPGTLLRIF
jgi:autotransporter-associated beta strand protein